MGVEIIIFLQENGNMVSADVMFDFLQKQSNGNCKSKTGGAADTSGASSTTSSK